MFITSIIVILVYFDIERELYDVLTIIPFVNIYCSVFSVYNELTCSLIVIILSGLIIHIIFLDNPICTRCQDNLVQIEELRRELEVTQKVKLNEMLNSIISPDPADRLTGPIKGIINETGEPRIPEIFQYYDTLIPSEMNY